MTEAEWLACDDPMPMLEFLGRRASDRKLRLFGCACCRRAWRIAKLPKLEQALALLEGFIEGTAKDADRGRAHRLGGEVLQSNLSYGQQCLGAEVWKAARKTLRRDEHALYDFGESAAAALGYAAGGPHPAFFVAKKAERAEQARLLRDSFGNPFREAKLDKKWRTDTVRALARHLYESSDFGAMDILADALQDAGCDQDDVLNHCRSEATHARGCWVIDSLLGKE